MPDFRCGLQDRSKIAVRHCRDPLVSAEGCYRASRHERGDNDCPDRNKYLKNRVLTAGNRSPPATLPKPNDWPVPKFPPHRIAKKLFSSRLVSALLDLGSGGYPFGLGS